MEIKKDDKKKEFFILLFKIVLVITFSFFIFLSLRTQLIISKSLIYIFTFSLIQIIFLLWLFNKHIILNTIAVIMMLNFLLTPTFFNITFDSPTRSPYSKSEILWDTDSSKGYFNEKHLITTKRGAYNERY